VNYLAHLVLAEPSEDSRLGALIGDFMRGYSAEDFAPGIRDGILLHRRIDELTDAHPVFRRSRSRFPEPLRRYSGVVVDVVYDHFLAKSFERWCATALRGFADDTYALLDRRFGELPERLQHATRWIVILNAGAVIANTDHRRIALSLELQMNTPIFGGRRILACVVDQV